MGWWLSLTAGQSLTYLLSHINFISFFLISFYFHLILFLLVGWRVFWWRQNVFMSFLIKWRSKKEKKKELGKLCVCGFSIERIFSSFPHKTHHVHVFMVLCFPPSLLLNWERKFIGEFDSTFYFMLLFWWTEN